MTITCLGHMPDADIGQCPRPPYMSRTSKMYNTGRRWQCWVHKSLRTQPRTSNDVLVKDVDPDGVRKHIVWDDQSAFSRGFLRRRLPTSGQNCTSAIVVK